VEKANLTPPPTTKAEKVNLIYYWKPFSSFSRASRQGRWIHAESSKGRKMSVPLTKRKHKIKSERLMKTRKPAAEAAAAAKKEIVIVNAMPFQMDFLIPLVIHRHQHHHTPQ